MKKRITALLLSFVLLAMICTPIAAEETAFTDVRKGAYYYDAVLWAVEQDITQGMGGSLFQPEGNCSRAQVVTFLWRLAGKPAAKAGTTFTDVPAGKWYADAVAWAVEEDITKGITATTFCPDDPCNRGQVVTFLYRYAMPDASEEDPNMGEWA